MQGSAGGLQGKLRSIRGPSALPETLNAGGEAEAFSWISGPRSRRLVLLWRQIKCFGMVLSVSQSVRVQKTEKVLFLEAARHQAIDRTRVSFISLEVCFYAVKV